MDNELIQRGKDLLARGNALIGRIERYEGDPSYWYSTDQIAEVQSWVSSVTNLATLICEPNSYFYKEIISVSEHNDLATGAPYWAVQKLSGILSSLSEEIEHGLLKKAEYIFAATTFDDFLDHASEYHKSNKKIESAVLASAVFEDTIRKIAKKNETQETSNSIESLIDNLVKENIFTSVKAKRIKSFAAVRNKALHAKWDEFDIKDVGELIKGTRDLIENAL